VLLADRAAKPVRELGSHFGIGETPTNVIPSILAPAPPWLDLDTAAAMKLVHGEELRTKAVFGHEHFHDVRIVSFCVFWSCGTFAEHARNRKCVRHLELRGDFVLCFSDKKLAILANRWNFAPGISRNFSGISVAWRVRDQRAT
jgi:hypothetical protein